VATEEIEKVWYTVPEVALYMGVTERWVRRQIAERHIEFNKVGGVIRIHADVMDVILEAGRRPAENGPPQDRGGDMRRHPSRKRRRSDA
jgi:excisionase family DNA binding protein